MNKLPRNLRSLLLLGFLCLGFLVSSCGGTDHVTENSQDSKTDTTAHQDHKTSPIESDTSGVNLMPSFQPTFGVAGLSDAVNPVVAANNDPVKEAADLAQYTKKISQEETVSGFIVKYKDTFSSTSGLHTAKAGQNNGGVSPSTMLSQLDAVTSAYGVKLQFRANAVGNATAFATSQKMTLEQAHQIAASIKSSNASIEYVEPDIMMTRSTIPDDVYFGSLWALQDNESYGIRAETAWNYSTGQNVVVAVVDTGITNHEDLKDNVLPGADTISVPWIANDDENQSVFPDVYSRDNDASDPGDYNLTGWYCATSASSWHGSHVAGTIAAKANNKIGVAGVAYNAKILPVRVLGRCGGLLSDVAAGIVWAVGGHVDGIIDNPPQNRAKVINLSLGGTSSTCSATMRYAIDFARSQGAMVVVAAGNEYTNAKYATPANCSNAITVGSNTRNGYKSSFSNYGALVDIAAPGEWILSTVDQSSYRASAVAGQYQFYSGTSMATPHVSAVLALMFAKNPDLTLEQAETLIKLHSSPFASNSQMALIGPGVVNAGAVLQAMVNSELSSVYPTRASFNADTQSDLLWRNKSANYNQMSLLGSGTMTTYNLNIASYLFSSTVNDTPFNINDFDGDGKSDIAWRRPIANTTSHRVYLTHMNGASHVDTTLIPKVISNTYSSVSTGNFGSLKTLVNPSLENDKADFYFRNNSTGVGFFCFFNSDYSQSMECSSTFTLSANLNLLHSTDFNNDGFIDFLFRHPTTGAMYIAYNTNRVTVFNSIGTLPVSESFVGVGDYDADGKADLLFRNNATTFISVASNPASSYLNLSVSTFGIPSYRTLLRPGDYNGDGKDDLIVRDNFTGVVSMANVTLANGFITTDIWQPLGTVSQFFSFVN